MTEYRDLTEKDVDDLIDAVQKFGKLYGECDIIGIDSSHIQVGYPQVLKLAELFGCSVTRHEYFHKEMNVNFITHSVLIDDVYFASQMTEEEEKNEHQEL